MRNPPPARTLSAVIGRGRGVRGLAGVAGWRDPRRFVFIVFGLLALLCCLPARAQHSIESIPNPKAQGVDRYVSDPDRNLSESTRAQLDAIATRIEAANGSEFAIVVVDDYNGDSDFQFALDLFTHWGIGKRGSNNGLLLFLSMDRHEYRFISGYGLEGIFPDALLSQIGEDYLVPNMQADDPDRAVLAAAKAVESVFLSPDHRLELDALQAYRPTFWSRHAALLEKSLAVLVLYVIAFAWMEFSRRRVLRTYKVRRRPYKRYSWWIAPIAFVFLLLMSQIVTIPTGTIGSLYRLGNIPYFIAAYGALFLCIDYYEMHDFIRKSTKDAKSSLDMQVSLAWRCLLPLLLSPLAWKVYYDLGRNRKASRRRGVAPELPGQWVRVNRGATGKAKKNPETYLSKLQLREEQVGSRSFEIWVDEGAGKYQVVVFPGKSAREFSICPKCQGLTLYAPETKVRKAPSYKETGIGEKIQTCAFCDYSASLGMVTLPVRERSSGSSGSGSSSGGGSSGGSSSGGSFGGGSSGGGGAGGRW